MKANKEFTLDQVCALVDLPKRTVRYYIQLGLVARPEGAARGAYYTESHVEQLLAVKKWREAGISLERIGEIVSGAREAAEAPRPRRAGDVEVWSHVILADGVELHLEPGRAGLSPEQVRGLISRVHSAFKSIQDKEE
jgi:DNA-binding transcriptional MerR regulator